MSEEIILLKCVDCQKENHCMAKTPGCVCPCGTEDKRMTTMPSSIVLLSRQFMILIEDPSFWNERGMGRSDGKKGIVALRSDMPHDAKMQTLIHEILHQIADINDLKIVGEETTISVLAAGIYDFLRRNPEMVRAIERLA